MTFSYPNLPIANYCHIPLETNFRFDLDYLHCETHQALQYPTVNPNVCLSDFGCHNHNHNPQFFCAPPRKMTHYIVQFKLVTLVYRSLHGLAPCYVSDDLRCVADIPSRRNLWSASSCQLEVLSTRLTSDGDRTFSTAGSRLWNSLLHDITECQTVEAFKRKLKTLVYHFLDSSC